MGKPGGNVPKTMWVKEAISILERAGFKAAGGVRYTHPETGETIHINGGAREIDHKGLLKRLFELSQEK